MLKGLPPDQYFSGQHAQNESVWREWRAKVGPSMRHPALALLLSKVAPVSEVKADSLCLERAINCLTTFCVVLLPRLRTVLSAAHRGNLRWLRGLARAGQIATQHRRCVLHRGGARTLRAAQQFATLTPPLHSFLDGKETLQRIREYSTIADVMPSAATQTALAAEAEAAGAIADDRRKQEELKRQRLAVKVPCSVCHRPGHPAKDCFMTNNEKREQFLKKASPSVKAAILKRVVNYEKNGKLLAPGQYLGAVAGQSDLYPGLEDSGEALFALREAGQSDVHPGLEDTGESLYTLREAEQSDLHPGLDGTGGTLLTDALREAHLGRGYQISPGQLWFTPGLQRMHTILVSGSAAMLVRAQYILNRGVALPRDGVERGISVKQIVCQLQTIREIAKHIETLLQLAPVMVRTSLEDLKDWASGLGLSTRALIRAVESYGALLFAITGGYGDDDGPSSGYVGSDYESYSDSDSDYGDDPAKQDGSGSMPDLASSDDGGDAEEGDESESVPDLASSSVLPRFWLTKAIRPSVKPTGTELAKEVGSLVWSDTCGPFRISAGGYRWFALFVDDSTTWIRRYFLKQKSDYPEAFKMYIVEVKRRRSGMGLPEDCHMVLHTDGDSTMIAGHTAAFCKERGIEQRHGSPYLHENQARVERSHRDVQAMARALLLASGFGVEMWPLAARHVVYILNRIFRRSLNWTSAYYLINKKHADLSHLRIFGRLAYPFIDPSVREHKLSNRDRELRDPLPTVLETPVLEQGVYLPEDDEEVMAVVKVEASDGAYWVLTAPDVAEWPESIQNELEALVQIKGALRLMKEEDVPPGVKLLDMSLILKLSSITIAIVLALNLGLVVHHMDVDTAFLNSVLEEDLYVRLPRGLVYGGCRPVPVFCGNQGAIHLASNYVNNSRSKHIKARNMYIRELIKAKETEALYTGTANNTSAIMTKPLALPIFRMQRERLGVTSLHRDDH
ncbi:hypothetical protein CYMTET_41212 [Cymbomonas tetramitiformis]|uniref:Integrase catalytic domain-containing protein n=1 Tax=Cymbomonas tetramitiformis TaxID=36881 RepID=A0AAE0F2R3_9CHLO|nr:hypothetical protein CYMTET_41212 [Cymbomonas tetramitiformis]